jgi:hypothetical protein
MNPSQMKTAIHANSEQSEYATALYEVLYIGVRFLLAWKLFEFGLAKVLVVQAPPPDPTQWIRLLGEMPPGDFLHAWIGLVPPYEIFLGLSEVLGGLIFLFRRTTTLGALITIGNMANMTALAYGFGGDNAHSLRAASTPGVLLALALILAAIDLRRLANIFVLQKPTIPAAPPQGLPNSPFMRRMGVGLKIGFVALVLCSNWHTVQNFVDLHHSCQLRGVYEVDSFTRDGQSALAAPDAAKRWRVVAIDDYCSVMTLRKIDDSRVDYYAPLDLSKPMWRQTQQAAMAASQGTFILRKQWNPSLDSGTEPPMALHYARTNLEELNLDGEVDGAKISAHLRRIPDENFPLNRPTRFWTREP